jgi:hypothetical protein
LGHGRRETASTGGRVRSSSSESGSTSCPNGFTFKSPKVAAEVDGLRIADQTEIVSELMGTGKTALRQMPLKPVTECAAANAAACE